MMAIDNDATVRGGHTVTAHAAIAKRMRVMALLTIATAMLLPLAQPLPLRDLSAPLLASLHVALKIGSAAIALAISLLAWSTRRGQPLNFVLAGFAFLAGAVLGAGQLVMLPGMPGLALGRDPRIAMVPLLAADSATVVALLAFALAPSGPGSPRAVRLGVALTAAGVAASVFLALGAPRWARGTEQAAAGVELLLASTALFSAFLLLRRYRRGQAAFGFPALAALLWAIAMAFSSGLPLQDLSEGLLEDTCKALASLLAYRALFREGVLVPWRKHVDAGRVLDADRQRYRQLFTSAPDGLLLVDAAGIIIQANPAAATMFGWSTAEIAGRRVETLMPQRLRAAHERAREDFLVKPHSREMGRGGSLTAARRDGTEFPVEVALVPQEFGDGCTLLCIVRDVTGRRQLEQALMRQALHDALTDLPNRRHFRDSLAKAMAHVDRHGGTLAVMFIDLDNFKQINDTLGHAHGDELLRQVSHRLCKTLRADDLLARMGGDEFALLLSDTQVEAAGTVAAKVLGVLEPEFIHAGHSMKIGASIGITMYLADGRSVEELLSHADIAMYRAKHRGRNTWCFFEQRMTEHVRERSSLQNDLVHAIERDQLHVVFQPRVRARDGTLTGFEALLRWRHPVRGNVSPDVFIALAEESGLIVPIGEWVLREACAQATRWRSAGAEGLTMAVNVSTHQLRHPTFAACVRQVLVDTRWPAQQLELEITETALMEDPREAAAFLHTITALGVRLAVDDFGTGYSSLAYLKDFPLHRLKVDRSFVRGLHTDGTDRVIASSVIALAHALGLQVTAEGVETTEQREFLVQQQCDELQGFLFSAPMSAADCEAWLPLVPMPS